MCFLLLKWVRICNFAGPRSSEPSTNLIFQKAMAQPRGYAFCCSISNHHAPCHKAETSTKLISQLLQQGVEKIDRLRQKRQILKSVQAQTATMDTYLVQFNMLTLNPVVMLSQHARLRGWVFSTLYHQALAAGNAHMACCACCSTGRLMVSTVLSKEFCTEKPVVDAYGLVLPTSATVIIISILPKSRLRVCKLSCEFIWISWEPISSRQIRNTAF